MAALESAPISGRLTAQAGRANTAPLLRARNLAGIVGLIGAAVSLFLGLSGETVFMQSYLYAFIFWTGISLGCFVLLCVVHMAGGSWGAMIRKPLEAGISVLPLMALLFIPLAFGVGVLYPWADAAYVEAHPLVGAKSQLLNTPGFIIRGVIYFAIWILGAVMFLRASARADADTTGRVAFGLRRTGSAWLGIYVMTFTFASIDWGMSLTPEWFSGIYGVILMIGQAIGAMALMIITMSALARHVPAIDNLLNEKRLQDLGNFLMAFTMFWAYVSVSQLIIIWSNNVVETASYYVTRLAGGWEPVAIFLSVFGFFAPFAILFSRWVKRKRRALVTVALWTIGIRLLDLYWILIPAFGRAAPEFRWLDIAVVVAMGGLWVAVYCHYLATRPLLPANDPRLEEALHGH